MKQGILWLPRGQDSMLLLLGDGMIPGREVRSYKPCGQKKKTERERERERETSKTPWRQNQDDLDGETPKGRGYICMCG